jgi:hypothetical protein
MRYVFILLLMFSAEVFGEESTPTQALDNFIALFNDENLDGLNQVSNAPWFTMVNGDSNSFSRYSDMVDFEGLKKTGWSYSRVENIDVLHDDGETAFVKALLERRVSAILDGLSAFFSPCSGNG